MKAAACALVALALLPSAASARDRCHRPGVRTVALTTFLRVYEDRQGQYVACLRRTGKRTAMFTDDELYTTGSVQAAAGRFVVYTVDYVPECKADCPPGVTGGTTTRVLDARTRRQRTLAYGRVWALRLDMSGAVSWSDADGAHALPTP